MSRTRLFHRLLLSSLLVVTTSVGLFGGYLFLMQKQSVESDLFQKLEVVARFVELEMRTAWAGGDDAAIQAVVDAKRETGDVRLTVVDTSGRVVADSGTNPRTMDNHLARPELVAAFAGRTGTSMRYSTTVSRTMMYVAIPAYRGDEIIGAVRAAVPMDDVLHILSAIRKRVIVAALVLLGIAALASYGVARSISRPVEQMSDAAERFVRGERHVRFAMPDTAELARLSASMTTMKEHLERDIGTIDRLLKEQRSVFQGMHEGVLFIDDDGRVADLNVAAANMLGVPMEKARGRQLIEIVRSLPLEELVQRVATTSAETEADLTLHGATDRLLHAHGSVLRMEGQEKPGALIVLSDVTRLRQLESIRRDFVANASHELKTPVTSIKGFAETLLSLDDLGPDARRFVEIIDRQADQLAALIDDLLDITRLEYAQRREDLDMEEVSISSVIEGAIEFCRHEAGHQSVTIEANVPEDLAAAVEPQLLQRAISNLLDNAIKYGGDGKTVRVSATVDGSHVIISVQDEGPGIAAEHLPRIFERFYRVDKARSRKLGGTGLGLSIVKHVAQAHGGDVSVESTVGAGSVFTIRLPATATTRPA